MSHDRTTEALLEPRDEATALTLAPAPSATSVRTRVVTAFSATLVGVPIVLGAGPALATAATASVPAPPTKALPAGLDVAPPYQRGTRCLTQPLPGVVAFAKLLNNHYGTHV